MNFDLQRIYELLPAIDRIRDAENGEPLKALLTAIAEQVAVLEEDQAQSYDDHFIETAAEWVVPYIGDLIGYRALRTEVPRISSPRSEVANTIGYRRRKGTVVALEQLARDVTGWHAHVVEFFQRMATTQYMNHIRPANRSPYIGGLARDILTGDLLSDKDAPPLWEPLERLNTPFDSLAHTLDVRRIPRRRGRYNIPNIGVFLWRLNSYSWTGVQPFKLDDRRYFFSPLGNDTPLFTLPETLAEFSGLSTMMNVPDPITRRTLQQYLEDYYGKSKSILLMANATAIAASEITVCDLSDIAGGAWAHQLRHKIGIDPVLGRIAFPSTQPPPADVRAIFHYGFSADIGGGEYDRTDSVPPDSLFRKSSVWQIGVTSSLPPVPGELVSSMAEAIEAWNSQPPGTTGVIALMDSSSYDDGISSFGQILVPTSSRLLIISADWPAIDDGTGQKVRNAGQFNTGANRAHLRGNISVMGQDNGEVHLNGLLVEGWFHIDGSAFGQVSVEHCTLVAGLAVTPEHFPRFPREPSFKLSVPDVDVEIANSITGGLRVSDTVRTRIVNSIVDSTSRCGVAFSASDDHSAGGRLHIENSTLIGKVHTTLMEMASNTIFFARLAAHDAWRAPVLCEQHQAGCIRFSYVPPGSRTPKRYRCQPAGEAVSEADAVRVSPQFTSLLYGEPGYAQLSRRCPTEIFSGADDESEMGAFHDLFEPQRITNLGVRLDEFLRFGLEAGIFFEPKMETRAVTGPAYGYGAVLDACGGGVENLPGIGAGLI